MANTKETQVQGDSLHLEDSWSKKDEEAPVITPTTRSLLLVRKACFPLHLVFIFYLINFYSLTVEFCQSFVFCMLCPT